MSGSNHVTTISFQCNTCNFLHEPFPPECCRYMPGEEEAGANPRPVLVIGKRTSPRVYYHIVWEGGHPSSWMLYADCNQELRTLAAAYNKAQSKNRSTNTAGVGRRKK